MTKYDHLAIEKKWQDYWLKNKTFAAENFSKKPKFYALDMFPYPSGAGLHVGHPEGYTATDIISRKRRHEGFSVLHPLGWDAFGLPAENYALKTGTHPNTSTQANIKTFRRQIQSLGFSYDWDREIDTTDPHYYKWSQWIFLQLYKKGLAYEKEMSMNWCPQCKIVAANEEVEQGTHERCGAKVKKKNLRQWMFRITDYAQRLLDDIDTLDGWSEAIKTQQRNWIGKSEGLIFTSPVKDTELEIKTFSTHFEAFTADTFVVIAPDHPFLDQLLEGVKNKDEIKDFCAKMIEKRDARGFEEEKESEGIFTGRYTVDPVGNGELPIWVASYALADYGTGIVKCSCHDERDFAFAKKYGIKLKPVLFPKDQEEAKKVKNLAVCYTDMNNGILTEPMDFAGKNAGECRKEIVKYVEARKLAEAKTTYKLRDWIFTRQRYWGEPIPLVFDEAGNCYPLADSELPLKLPETDDFHPTADGQAPLARCTDWINVEGYITDEGTVIIGPAPEGKSTQKFTRETSTMPNWAGSSWYWLRYMDPTNDKEFCDKEVEKYWGPVDLYVGGTEHAVLHLLYSRFWHKVLYDLGYVSTIEPFKKLVNQGLILGEDGEKMSKSRGNVVNPDEIVNEMGADTLRMYEMFMGPFEQAKPWSSKSTSGIRKFLDKVWRIFNEKEIVDICPDEYCQKLMAQTIKKVGEDIDDFKFNTAISQLMILFNGVQNWDEIDRSSGEKICILLSPFAPHLAEEIWSEVFGHKESICNAPWPTFDPKFLIEDTVTYAVQINGKLRGDFETAKDTSKEDAIAKAKEIPNVAKYLGGGEIKKEIFVSGKIVGFVVK